MNDLLRAKALREKVELLAIAAREVRTAAQAITDSVDIEYHDPATLQNMVNLVHDGERLLLEWRRLTWFVPR